MRGAPRALPPHRAKRPRGSTGEARKSRITHEPRGGARPAISPRVRAEELKDRVEAKRHALREQLVALTADTRYEAVAARTRICRGLAEVESYLFNGWNNVSESVQAKLREWVRHY